jgi:hypothetical protein
LAKTSRRFCDTPTKAGRPRAVSTFSLCPCVKLVQSYSKLRLVQSSYPFFCAPSAHAVSSLHGFPPFLLVPAPSDPIAERATERVRGHARPPSERRSSAVSQERAVQALAHLAYYPSQSRCSIKL